MNTPLKIGWAQADITPEQPVLIMGQFHARVSEGVRDPLTVTAMTMQSGEDQITFVSCDLVCISDELRDAVRNRLAGQTEELDPLKVILHATHTHTGATIRYSSPLSGVGADTGIDLEAMGIADYIAFAAGRIAQAVRSAWNNRRPGGMAFGQGYAVIGRNRRWVNDRDQSTMYGLKSEVYDTFRHMEGYEDHSVNILATYDAGHQLTGLLLNVPCPAQETEGDYQISADWWCEARAELRRRFGEGLFILPQCSAAGDLTSHLLYEISANERMLRLQGRNAREEIAHRLANAVEDVLPCLEQAIETNVKIDHRAMNVLLPMNRLTEEDARSAERQAEEWNKKYEEELRKLEQHPEMRNEPRWYREVTLAYRRMNWYGNVSKRYELQQKQSTLPAELHMARIGDMAFATNPFELYLDFGIQIKLRSQAVQTFLVQLAGAGTYVPSPRSVSGGGYGSVPASNVLGPEAGRQIVEQTVEVLRSLYNEE